MASPLSTTPESGPPLDLPATAMPRTPKASRISDLNAFTSPARNPTPDNSNYQQFSIQADEARGQLRNELKDKVFFVPKSSNFWDEIFSIGIVDNATVAKTKATVQDATNALSRLLVAPNPLEAKMYPYLETVFAAIKPGTHTKHISKRYWKDYHTKYPGVDSGVLMSGLRAADDQDAKSIADTQNAASDYSHKRRRLGHSTPTSGMAVGGTVDSEGHDSDELRRKNAPTSESTPPVFDSRKPDWLLLDSDSDGNIPKTPLWRQIAVILELKPGASSAPVPKHPDSSIIVQCTDYSRLHLSLRPFQLFTVHLSLCGTLFNAWIIDREGVLISESVDISKNEGLDIFLRVLIQVTTDLTMYELGMDPTVKLVDGWSLGDELMPSFEISMPSGNVYITQGAQIWQSSSLFGRGTIIWSVESRDDVVKGPQNKESTNDPSQVSGIPTANSPPAKPRYILKCSRRYSQRIGESDFYAAVQDAKPFGIAVFREGGDITHNNEPLTNARHRGELGISTNESVVHRLVLESRGRRLSEYNSVLELLKAVLACVKGHEFLFKNGIIHRDISIGNVFISDDANDAAAGFLGDLDMAKVYDVDRLSDIIGKARAKDLVKTTNLGSITGTVQFMALNVLKYNFHLNRPTVSMIGNLPPTYALRFTASQKPGMNPADSSLGDTSGSIEAPGGRKIGNATPQSSFNTAALSRINLTWEQAAKNDLESFIWVMLYAFCAKHMNSLPNNTSKDGRDWYCQKFFMPLFGGVSFGKTFHAHKDAADSMMEEFLPGGWKYSLIPEPRLWFILGDLMTAALNGTLDYSMFKKALEFYIEQETNFIASQN